MTTCEDAILERMGVDPERYEGRLTKTWGKAEGGSVNYSVELTPRLPTDFEAQLKATAKALTKGLKPIKRADPLGASDYGLLALSDLHMAQDGEGGVDAQSRRVLQLGVDLTDDMLSASIWNVGRVGILLNGDLTNVDNKSQTTTRGTRIEDTIVDYPTMYTSTLATATGLVNWVARRRPVDLFLNSGNHDDLTVYHLATALELAYADVDRVRVIYGKDGRIYQRWGASLMLFAHGHKVKNDVEILMSRERPTDFAETLYHYIYTGHVHRMFKVKNHYGLPALVDRSEHARGEGYPPELRGGIGHVFDLVKGRVGEVARHFA